MWSNLPHTLLVTPEQVARRAAIALQRSPAWHRRARGLRAKRRGRVRALRQAGCHPWLRDILYLHAHHSRPYSQFMGKHGNKWGAGQAPWQKERQGQGQQSEPSAYWSYWSGAWKGATQQAKQDETQGDSSLQQFPSYSQLKLPNSQQTFKSSDVAQDLSDVEEVGVTDYVKLLQKLLNGARRADAKLRKLSADKDNKMAQWEEFQRVMKNKFIEQRNLYNRDIKSIDKEVSTLTAHKHDVLRQIQDAVAGGGQQSAAAASDGSQPTPEDLAAWDSLMDIDAAPMELSPEDDIIKRALLAARNPKEFMDGGAAVRLGQQAGQQPGWEQLGPAADAFSTPQRRRPLVPPHTPLLSQQAGRRQTETEPTSGAVAACATVTSQYGASSPAVMDPYVGSPLPVLPKPLRTSRSPIARRSPHQKGPARTSVKEGARPTSVVRVAQERIQLGDVLHAKRQAAQQELQQQSMSINQGPTTVVSILDDDHDDHGRSIGTEVASLTTME